LNEPTGGPNEQARQADDLATTLHQTVHYDQRSGRDRRSGLPSNYCGSEQRLSGDRRSGQDRRRGADRRKIPDRRHGLPGRRAKDRKEFERRIEEGELTLEEIEFIRAIDKYKRKYNRPFPTWSEVLAIVKELGYVKGSIG